MYICDAFSVQKRINTAGLELLSLERPVCEAGLWLAAGNVTPGAFPTLKGGLAVPRLFLRAAWLCAEHVCASLRGMLYVLRRARRPHRPQHTAALGLQRAPWGRSSAHGLLRFPAGECAVRDAACACAGGSLWKPARGFLQTPVPSHTTRLCILPLSLP